MAINIGKNTDGDVTYKNPPIDRVLFPNIKEGASLEEIQEAVDAWLDEHPEATTTVQDGSILPVKLDSSNQATSGYILSYNGTKFEWVSNDILSKIATEYDEEDFYSAGDICSYNGNIYVCIAPENTIIQGEFNAQYWSQKPSLGTIVTENLVATNSELSDLKQDFNQLGLSVVNGALCVTYNV